MHFLFHVIDSRTFTCQTNVRDNYRLRNKNRDQQQQKSIRERNQMQMLTATEETNRNKRRIENETIVACYKSMRS